MLPPAVPSSNETERFPCPQCHTLVQVRDITCPSCGVNLALATALASQQSIPIPPEPASQPHLAEMVMPRFGEFLRDNGYITDTHLEAGLARQKALAAQGQQRTIGQVLLEMGHISREQLDQAGIQHVQLFQQALQSIIQQLEQHVAQRTQELRMALQKTAELNELKANFIANISHELRTPLVPVKGYLSLLTGGSLGAMNDLQTEALQVITRSLERLETLINELIMFASSVKGQMTITPTVFALNDLARRLSDYFGPRAEAAGVRLNIDLPDSVPLFTVDGEKIYWVLFQLVDNAVKFTPSGGEVVLGTEQHGDRLRIFVRDNGIGIPPEHLPELFQPFHKLSEKSPDQLYDGTGLGLALAKRIIDAHGSKMEVESHPGQGSTFWFDVPATLRS